MKSDFLKEYGAFLKKGINFKRPMKIVFDCSNGHVGNVLKEALKDAKNVKAFYLNSRPDGDFPGHGPNPSAPRAIRSLSKEVLERKADFGAVFDGDADRVVFVDDRGKEIDSDDLINFYCENRRPKALVIDLRVGWAVRERNDIRIVRTKVGNYFIKKAMIENKIDFGAERTGHYYFKINGAYIDGTVKMALAVGSLISGSGNISSWIDDHKTTFRLKEENFPVKNKDEAIAYIRKAYIKRKPKISDIDGLTMEFKDFWFNVRPSADEDLLRVNMESRSESVLQKEIGMLRSLIREK